MKGDANMEVTAAAVFAALCMAVLTPSYLHMQKKERHHALAITLKGLCTLTAVVLGLAGAIHSGAAYPWLMTAGLFLCLLGDVLLCIWFIYGVCAFLLGHLCYIAAFGVLAPFSLWSIAVFAGIFVLIAFLFLRKLGDMAKWRIPLSLYGAIVSAMVSLAALLPFTAGRFGWLPAAGGILFIVSDALLSYRLLIKPSERINHISLSCYYAGQYLLALSAFLFAYGQHV